ncbi:hypothetical protein [Erythrobacter sp. MTPC3]|uniref:hypothetical protein n=1 Tax=Erythrobacter sp. MTPC3 TaxID=3056564 RepID=UPI0036F376B2
MIAQEMGVSETRINQHIRALKNIFDANNLGDLVEQYRATLPEQPDLGKNPDLAAVSEGLTEDSDKDLSEASYKKRQVHTGTQSDENGSRVDHGELVMSDVLPLIEQAPWLRPGEPKVVPGVLDGDFAVLFRLLAILGVAFGFLAAVVLTVTAAMAISEALDGRATIPVDEQGFS